MTRHCLAKSLRFLLVPPTPNYIPSGSGVMFCIHLLSVHPIALHDIELATSAFLLGGIRGSFSLRHGRALASFQSSHQLFPILFLATNVEHRCRRPVTFAVFAKLGPTVEIQDACSSPWPVGQTSRHRGRLCRVFCAGEVERALSVSACEA